MSHWAMRRCSTSCQPVWASPGTKAPRLSAGKSATASENPTWALPPCRSSTRCLRRDCSGGTFLPPDFLREGISVRLSLCDNQPLRQIGRGLENCIFKAGITVHRFVLGEGEGFAGVGVDQHDHAEGSSHRRSYAIFVGNELNGDGLPAGLER